MNGKQKMYNMSTVAAQRWLFCVVAGAVPTGAVVPTTTGCTNYHLAAMTDGRKHTTF